MILLTKQNLNLHKVKLIIQINLDQKIYHKNKKMNLIQLFINQFKKLKKIKRLKLNIRTNIYKKISKQNNYQIRKIN